MKDKPAKSTRYLNALLKMGVLSVAVLAALAVTAPGPPFSGAASREDTAAENAVRQQLDQLTLQMTQNLNAPDANPLSADSDTAPAAVAALSPEQEEELRRLRDRLALTEEPLNLVEEPDPDADILTDPDLAALREVQEQVQAQLEAREQAKVVAPYINQELEDKKAQLAVEEARLRLERQSMEQLKEDIDRRLAELRNVQKAVEDLTILQQKEDAAKENVELSIEEREAKVTQVSKIIAQMKPVPAAQVLERLRNDLAVEVVSKITPRVAGKIMAALPAEKAAAISALMARQDRVEVNQLNQQQADAELDAAMREAGRLAQQAAASNQ
jgi:flagellar motility protein MotE (MotC chaperone)